MGDQLALFPTTAANNGPTVEPANAEIDRALARRCPTGLRFGTSSWAFPGWAGIVYAGTPTEAALVRDGLGAYARHPLLRTVSLDRGYYAPLTPDDLRGYARALDRARALAPDLPTFRVVPKAWDVVTTAVFPKHPRYGARAGERNRDFLSATRFRDEVLAAYEAEFHAHLGPFVFELTPMPRGALSIRDLALRVEAFLTQLPVGYAWSFELRNRELFGAYWLDMLAAHGASHVFSMWTAMPTIREQLRTPGCFTAPFFVARLMLPPFTRYAAQRAEFAPFSKIVVPQLGMRDDVVELVARAAEHGAKEGFILINNKAEGSAPLTARALVEQLPAPARATDITRR